MKKNVVVAVLCLLLVFVAYSAVQLLTPLPFGNKAIEFEIKKGASFRQAVDSLAENGLVRDKWVFLLLGKFTGADRRTKAGYYPLWGSMSPLDIFRSISSGKIIEYEITVIPGDSLPEIEDKFSALDPSYGEEIKRLSTDREFLDDLDIDAPSLEGYIYPDTYKFPKGVEIEEVVSMMVDRMRDKFSDEMTSQMLEKGLSEREVLTMASIVEKEAITPSERPLIAAVYYNRLRKHMRLQADPTTIYGVKRSNVRITLKDLANKTAYNTYLIKGLPPGPIASPGLKSIEAALNPANVPYLYFVSNNDGTHNFSVTLSKHLNAVRAYRNKRRMAASKKEF